MILIGPKKWRPFCPIPTRVGSVSVWAALGVGLPTPPFTLMRHVPWYGSVAVALISRLHCYLRKLEPFSFDTVNQTLLRLISLFISIIDLKARGPYL